ncbi:DUF664 domain-containing protein [Streptomyces sp. NPDC000961]|uniref:mycothiol transferase n=1 Tax=Streptomyces sp. NPDC000961 TaxID=3364541 RepID=UPI0036888D8B
MGQHRPRQRSRALPPRPWCDERTALTAQLAHQRRALYVTAYGLAEKRSRTMPVASELSIIGPLKPAVRRETFRAGLALLKSHDAQRSTDHSDADEFTRAPDENLVGALAARAAAAALTDAAIAGIADLGLAVPVR